MVMARLGAFDDPFGTVGTGLQIRTGRLVPKIGFGDQIKKRVDFCLVDNFGFVRDQRAGSITASTRSHFCRQHPRAIVLNLETNRDWMIERPEPEKAIRLHSLWRCVPEARLLQSGELSRIPSDK